MALNDLTPQLRTQMDKVEKWVAVIVASLLRWAPYLLCYSQHQERLDQKEGALFHTGFLGRWLKGLCNLGFKAGVITAIEPNAPGEYLT